MIALAIILTGIGSYTLAHFSFCAIALYLSAASLTGTGICRAHRHGSLGHLHAHHTRGRYWTQAYQRLWANLRGTCRQGNGQPHPVSDCGHGELLVTGLASIKKSDRPKTAGSEAVTGYPTSLISVKRIAPGRVSGSTAIKFRGFIMFRLTLLATVLFCISSIARAELWEDYALSDEVIEHTVIAVQGNYLDEYLVRLERTWVRSMEVQKELGYVNDYTILVSTAADTPNVWLNVEYPNMAAYQPNEEKWNKVNEILAERYGDDEEELDAIAKGYEEIRRMVDHQIVHKVTYR